MKHQLRILLAACITLACASVVDVRAQETLTQPKPAPRAPKPPAPEEKPAPPPPVMISERLITVGGMAGYSVDLHTASGFVVPDVPTCCPGYDGGSGGGPVAGLSVELPVSSKLDILGRIVYQTTRVTMDAREDITVRINDQPVPSFIAHEVTPSVSMASFEPGVAYHIAEGFSLLGGLRLGAVLSGTYEQRSTLDPSIPYDFSNGAGVREETAGDIPQLNTMQFGIFVGARYGFPLNTQRTLRLVPEVQFAPLFTSFVVTDAWSASSFRAMLGLQFSLMKSRPVTTPLRPE